MGQIFNRIKNISKSYLSDADELYYAQRLIDSDKDDLNRIIDNLNQTPKGEKSQRANTNKNHNEYQAKAKPNNSEASITLSDAYKVLEIKSDADIESIKSAYKTKIKEYHPDKVQTMGKEILDIANRKTKEINDAYNLIKNSRDF